MAGQAWRFHAAILIAAVVLAGPAAPAQDKSQEDPPSLTERTDAAVERGAKWLAGHRWPTGYFKEQSCDELFALAILVSGGEKDALKDLLAAIEKAPWKATYSVSLRAVLYALLLEQNPSDLDLFVKLCMAVKFLVESQIDRNGGWTYGFYEIVVGGERVGGGGGYGGGMTANGRPLGDPTPLVTQRTHAFGATVKKELEDLRKKLEKSKKAKEKAQKGGPAEVSPLKIARNELYPWVCSGLGDSSNSQFAALGLLAATRAKYLCMPGFEVKIQIPEIIVRRAIDDWLNTQNADGGWGYQPDHWGSSKLFSWPGHLTYGAMTAGGLFSLGALLRLREQTFAPPENPQEKKKDPLPDLETLAKDVSNATERAVAWLDKSFTAERHVDLDTAWPKESPALHLYYYLFSIERAAALLKRDRLGAHDWYGEGATLLLKRQEADGNWPAEEMFKAQRGLEGRTDRVGVSTCFAILFLKRMTANVLLKDVPTPGGGEKK
jgi:hypothetical protein